MTLTKGILTYESVWLNDTELAKVEDFIKKLNITDYQIQRLPAEDVSTITIPEISAEDWNKVEDFEFNLLVIGDWEESDVHNT